MLDLGNPLSFYSHTLKEDMEAALSGVEDWRIDLDG